MKAYCADHLKEHERPETVEDLVPVIKVDIKVEVENIEDNLPAPAKLQRQITDPIIDTNNDEADVKEDEW